MNGSLENRLRDHAINPQFVAPNEKLAVSEARQLLVADKGFLWMQLNVDGVGIEREITTKVRWDAEHKTIAEGDKHIAEGCVDHGITDDSPRRPPDVLIPAAKLPMGPSARVGIDQKALEEQDESLWAEVKPTENVGIPVDVPKGEMA